MITGIDHIEIIVSDLDAYVTFFERLGFEVSARTVHHGGSVEVRLPGTEGTIFELHEVIGEENPGINHIAFRCEDVHATYRELKGRGITFTSEPRKVPSTGRTNANLRDPGGFRLQLVDAARAEWEQDPEYA
jgi:glyoxylase I family protein